MPVSAAFPRLSVLPWDEKSPKIVSDPSLWMGPAHRQPREGKLAKWRSCIWDKSQSDQLQRVNPAPTLVWTVCERPTTSCNGGAKQSSSVGGNEHPPSSSLLRSQRNRNPKSDTTQFGSAEAGRRQFHILIAAVPTMQSACFGLPGNR